MMAFVYRLLRRSLSIVLTCLAGTCVVHVVHAGLPKGYYQLEYIQGDGIGAYIKTDYTPIPKTDRIEMDFALTSTAGMQGLLWSNLSNANRWDVLWFGGNNPPQFRFGYGTENTTALFASSPEANVRYTMTLADNVLTWTGGDGKTMTPADQYTCGQPLVLFASYHLNNVGNYSSMRLYSLVAKHYDTVIHDYQPCRRISDEVVGLYDLEKDVFHVNAGANGSFTAGPDNPPPSKSGFILILR